MSEVIWKSIVSIDCTTAGNLEDKDFFFVTKHNLLKQQQKKSSTGPFAGCIEHCFFCICKGINAYCVKL